MNTEQRIARLEGLLERVQRNAALPRMLSAQQAPPPPQVAEIDEDDIEIDDSDLIMGASLSPEALEQPSASQQADNVPSDRPGMVPSSMDEAFSDVAVPLPTLPPVQHQHPPVVGTSPQGEDTLHVDDGDDLGLASGGDLHAVAERYAPTVELEEPFDAELELDDVPPPSLPDTSLLPGSDLAEPAEHDLATLPPSGSAATAEQAPAAAPVSVPSTATSSQRPPPSTHGELEEAEAGVPAPPLVSASKEHVEEVPSSAAPVVSLDPNTRQRVERSALASSAEAIQYLGRVRTSMPRTFMEVLDGSLSLTGPEV